jgi:CheY-like chemotaxis protein
MAELAGLRALVVEDEGSVAWLIEGMLEELGCEVAASVVTLAEALAAATDKSFDFAVLDVNLAGELVFPVAELLQRRQLPFLFSTGYGRMGVPATFRSYEVLNKPFGIDELKRKLCIILGKRR